MAVPKSSLDCMATGGWCSSAGDRPLRRSAGQKESARRPTPKKQGRRPSGRPRGICSRQRPTPRVSPLTGKRTRAARRPARRALRSIRSACPPDQVRIVTEKLRHQTIYLAPLPLFSFSQGSNRRRVSLIPTSSTF